MNGSNSTPRAWALGAEDLGIEFIAQRDFNGLWDSAAKTAPDVKPMMRRFIETSRQYVLDKVAKIDAIFESADAGKEARTRAESCEFDLWEPRSARR